MKGWYIRIAPVSEALLESLPPCCCLRPYLCVQEGWQEYIDANYLLWQHGHGKKLFPDSTTHIETWMSSWRFARHYQGIKGSGKSGCSGFNAAAKLQFSLNHRSAQVSV